MRKLNVFLEIGGEQTLVGHIAGEGVSDARFTYAREYLLSGGAAPISVSLPLQDEAFPAARTRYFFEGLLPEGFTGRSVAQWLHTDQDDYLAILFGLGQDCLGALRITQDDTPEPAPAYERLDHTRIRELAAEGATVAAELVTEARVSLTGASGKVGLYYDAAADAWYLPHGTAPGTHIVKQSHIRYEDIVTNEQLIMMTAARLGIEVPKSFIVRADEDPEDNAGFASRAGRHGRSSEDGAVLYATERYDRSFRGAQHLVDGLPVPLRLHQEDLAQAMGVGFARKYEADGEHYLRDVCAVIRNHSSDPLADLRKVWQIVCFDWLVGNTDAHLKNFSLLYAPDLSAVRLAPAYDLVSTIIYPGVSREMAFAIGGKRVLAEIGRESFAEAAAECGIARNAALRILDGLVDGMEAAVRASAEALCEEGFLRAPEVCERVLEGGGVRYV